MYIADIFIYKKGRYKFGTGRRIINWGFCLTRGRAGDGWEKREAPAQSGILYRSASLELGRTGGYT